MAARFRTLDDLPEDLTGKKVLVRVDLNVPMDGAKVTDDTRLRAMLPTVLELSDRGAIVLLLSHFGRPKGEVRPDMSTAQLVLPIHRLGELRIVLLLTGMKPAVLQHPDIAREHGRYRALGLRSAAILDEPNRASRESMDGKDELRS